MVGPAGAVMEGLAPSNGIRIWDADGKEYFIVRTPPVWWSSITRTDFGYIQGKLARGYQIAAAFLSGKQQRFAVAGTLHPAATGTAAGG